MTEPKLHEGTLEDNGVNCDNGDCWCWEEYQAKPVAAAPPTSNHRSLQQEVQDLRNHVFNGVDLIEHLLRDPTDTAKAWGREWCAAEIARATVETTERLGHPTNNYLFNRMLQYFGFDPEQKHHVADVLKAIDAKRSSVEPSPVTNSSGSVSRPVDVPALAVGADQPTGAAALEAGTAHPPRVLEEDVELDLACEEYIEDPHSRFCDRCGYPEREHRRTGSREKASGKHDSGCVYYYGKPCDCGAENGTGDGV